MFDKASTVCIARDIEHAIWVKGVIDNLYKFYPLTVPCWYDVSPAGIEVKILGNVFQVDLAKTVVDMKEFTKVAMAELKEEGLL